MKNIHYLFMLLILCYYISECGVKEGYDFLIENREKINMLFNKELSYDYMPHIKSVHFKVIDSTLHDKNLTYNDSIAYDLCNRFIFTISQISLNASGTEIIIDSTLFLFFSKILTCTANSNEKDANLAERAVQTLIEKAGFAELVKYKSILKPALQKSCVSYNKKNSLTVLMGLSETEKNEFLEKDILPVHYRARIGDTSAMKILIKNYEKSDTYHYKVDAIKNIMESGNRELIKHVLLDFNDPIYHIKNYKNAPPCTSSSTQLEILQSLARYYPENKLFNEELYKYYYTKKYRKDISFIKNHIILICKWIKKEYEIAPKSAFPPAYIISGSICPQWMP